MKHQGVKEVMEILPEPAPGIFSFKRSEEKLKQVGGEKTLKVGLKVLLS